MSTIVPLDANLVEQLCQMREQVTKTMQTSCKADAEGARSNIKLQDILKQRANGTLNESSFLQFCSEHAKCTGDAFQLRCQVALLQKQETALIAQLRGAIAQAQARPAAPTTAHAAANASPPPGCWEKIAAIFKCKRA